MRLSLAVVGLAAAVAASCAKPGIRVSTSSGQPSSSSASYVGTIRGTIVHSTTGSPAAGARVRVGLRDEREVAADANGNFLFADLPPGHHRIVLNDDDGIDETEVTVSRAARMTYGGGINERWIDVAPGETSSLTIRMLPIPVLEGVVTDESGQPVVKAIVQSFRETVSAGRRTLSPAHWEITDQDGGFRLTPFFPGDYIVTADYHAQLARMLDPNARVGFLERGFYENADTIAGASRIHSDFGSILPRVKLTLRRGTGVTIAGSIQGGASPALGLLLPAVPPTEIDRYAVQLDQAGHFTVNSVRSGEYILNLGTCMSPSRSGGRSTWARQRIGVGTSNIEGLIVTAQDSMRVTGRVVFDGVSQRPSPKALAQGYIFLRPPEQPGLGDVIGSRGLIDEAGRFVSEECPAGRYIAWAEVPSPWKLRSVIVQGRDAADTPLELSSGDLDDVVITFTDRSGTLNGRVFDRSGRPRPIAAVVVFPADSTLWTDFGPGRRLRLTVSDESGNFHISDLAAGKYLVAAIEDIPTWEWREAALFQRLAVGATGVAIAEGIVTQQELQMLPGFPH